MTAQPPPPAAPPTPAATPAPQAPPALATAGGPPVQVLDWGNQTTVFQTRQPAFWLLAITVVITALIFLSREVTFIQRAPTGYLFGLVLLALFAVPFFAVVYFLDLYEREPITLLATALIWGGVVSIAFASPTNTAWLQIFQKILGPEFAATWGPAFIGPAVEETLKFLGIIVIYLIARSEIDDLYDGFVYGALIGLGFAVVEDLHYFIRSIDQAGAGAGEFGPVLESYWIRVVAGGLYGHSLYTGIAGIGFAYYVTRLDQPKSRRLQIAVGAFGLALLGHFFWNSPILNELILGNDPGPIHWLLYGLVKGLPLFIFLVLMIRLALGREQRWFHTAVGSHVGGDALTHEDMKTLGDLRSRFGARRAMKRQKGPVGEKLLSRVQGEQLRLAMMATKSGVTQPEMDRQVEVIRGLRTELANLPDAPKPVLVTAGAPMGTPAANVATVPAPTAAWVPTHLVPPEGLQSWDQPDPSRPMTPLAGGLELRVVQRVGDWAQVAASNGWTGWVDARRLVAKA
jgi:RsiW-degrading membrane proteinase PrsW (M82 family)